MANENKEFKLEEQVEKLAKRVYADLQLSEDYEANIDLGRYSRERSADGLDVPILPSQDSVNYQSVLNTMKQDIRELNEEIKPVYSEVKKRYVDGLSEDGKLKHYRDLLGKGVIPDEASDELKNAAGAVKLTSTIKTMLAKGKVDELVAMLSEIYKADINSLFVLKGFAAYGSRSNIINFAGALYDKLNKEAEARLKDKKLYEEIEKAVEATDSYGLAFADAYRLSLVEAENKKKEAEAKKAEAETKAKEAAKKKAV